MGSSLNKSYKAQNDIRKNQKIKFKQFINLFIYHTFNKHSIYKKWQIENIYNKIRTIGMGN